MTKPTNQKTNMQKNELYYPETPVDAEIKMLCASIVATEQYIATNRFDRAGVREAESDLAEMEARLYALRHQQRLFRTTATRNKIQSLYQEYNQLDARQNKLDDRMFACQVNMDTTCRDAATCSQASEDYEHYAQEYQQLTQRMIAINAELKKLGHIK